jgi:hypothetical protein
LNNPYFKNDLNQLLKAYPNNYQKQCETKREKTLQGLRKAMYLDLIKQHSIAL